jgi:hypothetical protein
LLRLVEALNFLQEHTSIPIVMPEERGTGR